MEGWSIVPMGDLCSIQSGKSDTKDAVADGQYAFFDRSKTVKRSNRFLRDCEALIIPGEGTEFLPRHFIGKFDLHQRAYALFDFSPRLEVRYLYYFLHHVADYFPRVAVGATVKSLRLRHFQNLLIRLSPPEEQRRIVAILDEAFEAIATAKANTEKNLQNTRDAFLAYRTAVLSTGGDEWDERQLGAVCVLQRGLDLPSRDRKPGPYPLLSSSGLIDTHVEGPVRGPGVVTGRSGSIGSVFYVEQDFWPLNTVLYVRDFCGNHPRFVYHLLEHFDLKRFASGAGVPTLNRNIVHEEIVLVPQSLSAQEKVADSLDKLYAACQKVEKVHVKKVSALDELKKSLLHQAFTGQLTAKSTDQQLEAVA